MQVTRGCIVSTVCGRTKFSGKIFGGEEADPERWPWQAALLFKGVFICGAVLIKEHWVATAAHCFQKSRSPSDYRILLGYNELSNPTQYSRQMTVNKVIVPENYNKLFLLGSDIALLQLHMPVEFNSHILPACVLENTTKVPLDSPCWISGWGMLTEDTYLPEPMQLQEADLILLDNSPCAMYFPTPPPEIDPRPYTINDDVLCAMNFATGRAICPGDSRGPLVCPVHGIWYVVGVSSWSVPCIEPITTPNIFTRISYFYDWIQRKKTSTPPPNLSAMPPKENLPALKSNGSQGSTFKPVICTALLASLILLQFIWLRTL